jgi:HD-like signal output (HDOD) protein
MIDLDNLVKSANELEPLPLSVTRLMKLLGQEDVSIEEIEKIFSLDGVLAAQLLRQANSAFSSSREPIGTISAAVVRLGLSSIMALAVSVSTTKQLSLSIPQYGLEEWDLWRHAQACRLATEAMKKMFKISIPVEAPIAALLHDIGKLVLGRALGPAELAILRQANQDNSINLESENELLEVNHGELGGLIAQHWQLPDTIVRSIIYHHDPENCTGEDNTICHVLCFANWAAKAAVCKMDQQAFTEPVVDSAKILGIDVSKMDQFLDQIISSLENLSH